jgi:hypothetical protein
LEKSVKKQKKLHKPAQHSYRSLQRSLRSSRTSNGYAKVSVVLSPKLAKVLDVIRDVEGTSRGEAISSILTFFMLENAGAPSLTYII